MADATGPVQFFMLGQQAALNERMQKIKQLELEREQQLPTARSSYFSGDPSQLQQLAPTEWSTLETNRAQRVGINQKTQADAVERARQEQVLRSRGMLAALGSVRQDPSRWPSVVATIEQNGLVAPGTFDPSKIPTVADIDSAIGEQRMVLDTMQDPKLGDDIRDILIANNYSPNDPSGLADPRIQQAVGTMIAARNEGRRKPNTVVNVGDNSPLGTGVANKIQTQIYDARIQMDQLGAIKDAIAQAGGYEAIGSAIEGVKSAVTDKALRSDIFAGFVPQDARERLGNRVTAIASMAALVNKVINDLAGANVPEGEMMRMRRSLPSEDDNAVTIKAKIDTLEDNLRIIERHGIDALKTGIHLKDYNPPRQDGANTSSPSSQKGIIITNGTDRGILPPGQPMPQGWRAE